MFQGQKAGQAAILMGCYKHTQVVLIALITTRAGLGMSTRDTHELKKIYFTTCVTRISQELIYSLLVAQLSSFISDLAYKLVDLQQ